MNALAQRLLNLAFALAPRKNRIWLEDMRYEAAFVEHPLPWSLAALGLAVRWRLAKILATPSQLAFASAAMAAVAAVLIVPNLFQPKTMNGSTSPLPQAVSPAPATAEGVTNIDPGESRSAEAQNVPAESADAAFSEPTAPTLPEPIAATLPVETPVEMPTETAEAVAPTLPVTPSADSEANDTLVDEVQVTETTNGVTFGAQLPAMPEDSSVAASEAASTGVVPPGDTEAGARDEIEAMIEAAIDKNKKSDVKTMTVISPFVNLKIVGKVTLEVYKGTSAEELLFNGTTKAGQTLIYDLPIYIKASHGQAVQIYTDEQFRGVLGNDAVEVVITQSE